MNSEYEYEKFNNPDFKILNKYFVEKDGKLFLKSNEISIDRNLYIPNGYEVIVKPNQIIILTNNAFIISNSSFIINENSGSTKGPK